MDLDHACLLTSSLFRHGVRSKYLRFSIPHACECCHDSMPAMRLSAYVLKLLECLWVKVGLFEVEKLIEIRVLAYLRVANSKVFFFKDKRICNAYFQIRQSSLYLFAARTT